MAKILVVDDDPAMLAALKEWLMTEQHEVAAAATGLAGWELMRSQDFGLIVLDWDLPDIDGIDLLKQYRTSGNTTPVLMLTGQTSIDNKAQGLDSGADDYLTKPFHMKELFARVRSLLRRGEPPMASPKALGAGNEGVLEKGELAGTALAARYEFLEVVGEGGLGIVFKARHPQLDKLVAIKMIQKRELQEGVIARFEQEAKAVSRLDHPNIAVVHDFGTTERNRPYMVMDFIDGQGLDQIIDKQNNLSFEDSIDIAIQVCAGMLHAHSVGIIHRDLKPSNLILKNFADSSSVVKIVDFGCAKLRSLDAEKSPNATRVGEIIGSPAYMSPEQVHGNKPDERSDIYSLGCVLYEMLTGFVPHPGDDPMDIMVKHISEDAIPLHLARPDLKFPRGTEWLIGKALARDPEKRYPAMNDLKEDLCHLQLSARRAGNNKLQQLLGTMEKSINSWFSPKTEPKD